MKIVVLGANGEVGSRIVGEALARGHEVTAAVRSLDRAQAVAPEAHVVGVNAEDAEAVAEAITGHDLVVTALRPAEGREEDLVVLTRSVLDAANSVSLPTIVVGGAARLHLPEDPANTILTAPGFLPSEVRPIATACQHQFEMVATRTTGAWSYISPPAMLSPGRRTGRYRTGTDTLIVDEEGQSAISMEDFAVAILDEAEAPKHHRAAFTVGY